MERMRMEKERLGRMEVLYEGNRSIKALYGVGLPMGDGVGGRAMLLSDTEGVTRREGLWISSGSKIET